MGRDGEGIARPVLRVHHELAASRSNGPGVRYVIWVQGCARRCPGCFNPETHDPAGGRPVAVDALFRRVVAHAAAIEGITISGGEPLDQAAAMLALLRRVRRETALSTVLFTGYTFEEARAVPGAEGLEAGVDLLVAGPYDAARRLARDLRGSANQTVHFLSRRYAADDLAGIPEAELLVEADGSVIASGIDPAPPGGRAAARPR